MNIVHLISGGDSGGAKTHIFSLLQGLGRTDRVLLVCFRAGAFSDEAQALGIPTAVIDHRNIFRTMHELRRRIAEGSFDIIHCHGSRANMIGALLRRRFSAPVVSTVHSDYRLDYMGRPFGQLFYGNINALSLRLLDYRIGVSDAMVDTLISRGFPPDTLFPIYNGIDFPLNAPLPDRAALHKKLGLQVPEGALVAGIAARLSPVKDVGTLVRAFSRIAAQCPRLYLLIAGDGQQRHMLEKLTQRLGLADRVHFAGWVSEMDHFYGAIDINVLTSLSETFPYALTEGARMRLPTVSSRVGGVPYLIEDGLNGLLFPPGDDEALACQLKRLAENESLCRTLGQRLYDRVLKDYSAQSTCARQREIYEALLRRNARPKGRDGVVVCGAYGRGNSGDDAILEAVLSELRSLDCDRPICVMSRSPKETRLRYRVPAVYTFAPHLWLRRMRRAQLYLNGGGSLMQNVTSRRSLWFYLYTIAMAKRQGCRVLMYGCGIGPIRHESDRARTARILNRCVDAITLRDGHSLSELSAMGIDRPEIVLSADPTVWLQSAPEETMDALFEEWGLDPRGEYIAFSLRRWPGYAERAHIFGQAADYAYETYGLTPLFLPIERRVDTTAARAAAQDMRAPHHIISGIDGSARVIGAFKRMRVAVSMRLHGLVFAAGQGVPVVGVVYDPKVSSFLDCIGQDLYTELESLTPEALKAQIDTAVARSRDRSYCASAMSRLRDLERHNVEAAKKLLS